MSGHKGFGAQAGAASARGGERRSAGNGSHGGSARSPRAPAPSPHSGGLKTLPLSSFVNRESIGGGTFGEVFRAKEVRSKQVVALKMVMMDKEKDGFPVSAIREIKIMRALQHKNILHLRGMAMATGEHNAEMGNVYLVFDYHPYDLHGVIERMHGNLTLQHIRSFMKQLLEAVHFAHVNNVLHRDLKTSNILLSQNLEVKVADWGLARAEMPLATRRMTHRVVTLWYRAPELLLKTERYSGAVDMWSVGCVFAELLMGKPILPGNADSEQLKRIFSLVGDPTPENWPGVEQMAGWGEFGKKLTGENPRRSRLEATFKPFAGPKAIDLLKGLLCLDPERRLTAAQALDHDFFWEPPIPPDDPSELPRLPVVTMHEKQAKELRKRNTKITHGPVNGGGEPSAKRQRR